MVVLTAAASPASGQEAHLATDPKDDQTLGGAAPGPAGGFPAADLVALDFAADVEALHVILQVADLASARPGADSSMYDVDLTFDGSRYLVDVVRTVPLAVTNGVVYSAHLSRWDDGFGYWRAVQDLDVTPDDGAGTMTATVPLQKLLDPTGLPVRNGSQLVDVVVTAVHGEDRVFGGASYTPLGPSPMALPFLLFDRLPDSGTLAYEVSLPLLGGAVLLDSPDPARSTNGGPGTFVFPVRATNAADHTVVTDLTADGLPPGWTASIVDERMELAADESRTTNVVVKPPLAHVHGSSTNITVRAAVDGQPTDASVVLQLLYSDPAQPAGHHPHLYLHALDDVDGFSSALETGTGYAQRTVYMNTDEEDELDSGKPTSARGLGSGQYEWRVPMSPGLGMGLDFDVAGTGHLTAAFASTNKVEVPDAVFGGRLVRETLDGDVVLAEAPALAPVAVSEGTTIGLDFAMKPEADYVPYAPHTNLVLVVTVAFTEPGADVGVTGLNLLDGAWLALPLLEYQDQIPLQALDSLAVRVDPEQAMANPGDTVAFTLTLSNDGDEAVTADLEPLDISAASVLDLGASSVRVPAGGQTQVEVHVLVAEEAVEGELFNAFVAVRPHGQEASILVRLTTTVTTTVEVDSAVVPPAHDTPALPWVVLVAALALVARRRAAIL